MVKRFTPAEEVANLDNENIFKPQITVMGIGGAGINSVNNMINMGLSNVKFVAINTDSQSLEKSIAPYKLQIGPKVTQGLGAGSKPEIGVQSAEESIEEIKDSLSGTNMLILMAGMGGGTGTGASQVIAKIAKDMGILTMSFVTKPFNFEGNQRMEIANKGLSSLEEYTDSLVIIANQNLVKIVDNKTSVSEAFRLADNVLYSGIKAVTDLINSSGLVNLDFNDIRSVIEGMGKTMIGTAEAGGENRCEDVTMQAMNNELLDNTSMQGAKKILINITGGDGLTLHEVDSIISNIKEKLEDNAFIHFGTVFEDGMEDKIRVSILATGLSSNNNLIFENAKVDNVNLRNNIKNLNIDEDKVHKFFSKDQIYTVNKAVGFYDDKKNILKDNEEYKRDLISNDDPQTSSQIILDEQFENLSDNEGLATDHTNLDILEEVDGDDNINRKKANLFDLITKSKISTQKKNHLLKEENLINIKNRNIASKVNSISREDSFFDLPSFLKSKK